MQVDSFLRVNFTFLTVLLDFQFFFLLNETSHFSYVINRVWSVHHDLHLHDNLIRGIVTWDRKYMYVKSRAVVNR